MAATIYSTAQVAEKFETDTRTLRKFLRSPEGTDSKVGKGQRWGIEAKKVASLQKRFNAWNEARTATNSTDEATDAPADSTDA
jgi:hypothetical protein